MYFLVVALIGSFVLYYRNSDAVTLKDVVNTTCVFTDISVDKIFHFDPKSEIVYYTYNVTVKTHNQGVRYIHKQWVTLTQLAEDNNLLHKERPCYLVRNQLHFDYPIRFDKVKFMALVTCFLLMGLAGDLGLLFT